MRIRVWVAAAVAAFIATVGLPVGFVIVSGYDQARTVDYVRSQLRHSCAALELLTAKPVPVPSRNAGQSRVTLYRFYRDLVYWRNADGCGK